MGAVHFAARVFPFALVYIEKMVISFQVLFWGRYLAFKACTWQNLEIVKSNLVKLILDSVYFISRLLSYMVKFFCISVC